MRYLSMFSGIEAATVAWHPLGWEPAAFCEIEPFPSAVLAHHYPQVPNLGDVTKADFDDIGPIDLAVFGSPCQSFSIAGKRLGLDDPRGNLALYALGVVERLRPRWFVFENVPGLLSSGGGRDFGAFLGTVEDIGYQCAWRVLDAQYFGVPQRRRRVFVVGHLGDWRRAAAVLFERHSLSGDTPPRRETGQGFATDVAPSLVSSGRGVERTGETRGQDPVIAVASTGLISHCLNAGGMGRQDYETETRIAHTLKGEGFDASEDGTGRGTPLVPVLSFKAGQSEAAGGIFVTEEFAPTLQAANNGSTAVPCVAIQAGALRENPESGVMPAIAFTTEQTPKFREGAALTLTKQSPTGGGQIQSVMQGSAVRRLTPRECERLQGFPDDYTQVPYRNKPAADGPRYKALGNSMAVPVMSWIGERIQMIDMLYD